MNNTNTVTGNGDRPETFPTFGFPTYTLQGDGQNVRLLRTAGTVTSTVTVPARRR